MFTLLLSNNLKRHAAASYGHIQVLDFLISRGQHKSICYFQAHSVILSIRWQCEHRWWRRRYAFVHRRRSRNSPFPRSTRCCGRTSQQWRHISVYYNSIPFESFPTLILFHKKPIDHLNDEYPHISDYLRSTLDPSALPTTQPATLPSQHSQDAASEQLTSSLISSAQEIMEQAQTEGRDPEEELRQVVSRTVLEGVLTGFEMSTDSSTEDDSPSKRPKNK